MTYNILAVATQEIDKETSLFIILFLLKIFLNIDWVRMPQIVCLGEHDLMHLIRQLTRMAAS